MGLKEYQKKRSFEETKEPKGSSKKGSSKIKDESFPVFCIQKHDASHLHYDFRLEHKGVLLSWAVPKGPSLNPKDKRLAIQVEDHPFDYRHFEGTIPEGNYGAGTVMIWDEGTYTVLDQTSKKEIEKAIDTGLKKGHLNFILMGKKLQGSYSLVKIKSEKDNQWLLIKGQDEYVETKDVTEQDTSVKTNRNLKEIAETKSKKKVFKSLPRFIKPMLATLVKKPFDDPDWIFETKWDGYRSLAYIDKDITLYSRNEIVFNSLFSPIAKDLENIKAQCILDGEIVILNSEGKSEFQLLQNYQKTKKGNLFYFVFDLLFLNGEDIRNESLIERKEKLKDLLNASSLKWTRFSDHFDEKGKAFFKKAKEYALEGIMAKKKTSTYHSSRSKEWLKIKTEKRQEAIIIGFTEPRGTRKNFGSLLLGAYDKKKQLTFIGHVGTGFTESLLKELYNKMKPLIIEKSSLEKKIKTNMTPTWIKPKLVCEINFSEWTSDGLMRHPSFIGLRIDKEAKQVQKEIAI